MGHEKQVMYNKRWRHNRPEVFKNLRKRRHIWYQVTKQFCRIGIYDEFPESRGVKYY